MPRHPTSLSTPWADRFYKLFQRIECEGFIHWDPGTQNWGILPNGRIIGYDLGSYQQATGKDVAEDMFLKWLFSSGLQTMQDVDNVDLLLDNQPSNLIDLVKRRKWADLMEKKACVLPMVRSLYVR